MSSDTQTPGTSPAWPARARVAINTVRADIERDVRTIDGSYLDGATIGRMFGQVLAQVDLLARVLDDLILRIEETKS
jgi:hypothetical protein